MAEYRTVARLDELPVGASKAVPLQNKTIALFNLDGEIHAIDDLCPHMGASLATGAVADGVVTCPWHAWRFRICDGTWINSPKLKIPCYPVRIVDGEIQVAI